MDITPIIPKTRQLITGYGAGGFSINHERMEGSIIVLPERTLAWGVAAPENINEASLAVFLPSPLVGEGGVGGNFPRAQSSSLLHQPPHPDLPPQGGKEIELLLIGTGVQMVAISPELRAQLKQAGIALDVMDTGAACRTYNVLMAEERRVAAALVAV